jgi:hypothetical protein
MKWHAVLRCTLAKAMQMTTKIFFIALCVVLAMACSWNGVFASREVVVEFRLKQTAAYCGGARPSDEMLAELAMPKPLANVQFYVKSGSINDPNAPALISSFSDHEGVAFVPLKPGKYLVVFEDKQDWTQYNQWKKQFENSTDAHSPVDTLCLRKWIQEPEAVFEVRVDSALVVEIIQKQKCFWNAVPCLEYVGSIPP